MIRSTAGLVLAALFALPLEVQDSPATGLTARIPSSAVELTHYTPTLFDADEILSTASQLFGEQIEIVLPDSKGKYSEESSTNDTAHFILLGRTLLIRDSAEHGVSIVKTLRELEESEAALRRKEGVEVGAPGSATSVPREKLVVDQLRVRYLSFDALNTVLASFMRNIEIPNTSGGTDSIMNFTPVPEAGFVLARDTAERIAEVKKLLEQIDRPVPTVQVSALILRIAPEQPMNDEVAGLGYQGLPPELVEGLRAIVPVGGVETIGVAVVRASIQPGRACTISNQAEDGGNWTLEFSPDSFDAEGRQVGLSNCSFHIELPGGANREPSTQQFQTNLSVNLGEYTILGAVGAKPVFVALRIDPVRGRAN